MTLRPNLLVSLLAITAAAGLLSGCTESRLRLDPNFGSAVRQDAVAQIADPDAHYSGNPAPGANGERADLAQKRYSADKVTPPKTISAMGNQSATGGQGGGGGMSTSTGGSGP